MITEIEIEDVGTCRIPNMWQYQRIKQMARGANKDIAPFAASVCMTLKQFKTLPIEKQREVMRAYYHLTSPGQFGNGRGSA